MPDSGSSSLRVPVQSLPGNVNVVVIWTCCGSPEKVPEIQRIEFFFIELGCQR